MSVCLKKQWLGLAKGTARLCRLGQTAGSPLAQGHQIDVHRHQRDGAAAPLDVFLRQSDHQVHQGVEPQTLAIPGGAAQCAGFAQLDRTGRVAASRARAWPPASALLHAIQRSSIACRLSCLVTPGAQSAPTAEVHKLAHDAAPVPPLA